MWKSCLIFDVITPKFSLPSPSLCILDCSLMNYLRENVMTYYMPKPVKLSIFHSWQKSFTKARTWIYPISDTDICFVFWLVYIKKKQSWHRLSNTSKGKKSVLYFTYYIDLTRETSDFIFKIAFSYFVKARFSFFIHCNVSAWYLF